MSAPDFSSDILAAVRALPPTAPLAGPDPDDVHRALDYLCDRHGALEVLPADHNGSARILAEDGREWRVTRDGRMVVGR
jgi:hypothetical protein